MMKGENDGEEKEGRRDEKNLQRQKDCWAAGHYWPPNNCLSRFSLTEINWRSEQAERQAIG